MHYELLQLLFSRDPIILLVPLIVVIIIRNSWINSFFAMMIEIPERSKAMRCRLTGGGFVSQPYTVLIVTPELYWDHHNLCHMILHPLL